jgi:hypothetical protein
MLFRWGRTWSDLGWFRLPLSSKRGVAVVGAGTLYPDIGASGEGDGFHRIARQTATTGAGTPMVAGKAPTEDGVMTAGGEARTAVGAGPTAAHNREQPRRQG